MRFFSWDGALIPGIKYGVGAIERLTGSSIAFGLDDALDLVLGMHHLGYGRVGWIFQIRRRVI
jgi:hypothetical protein